MRDGISAVLIIFRFSPGLLATRDRARPRSYVRRRRSSTTHSSAEGIIRANEHRIIYIYIYIGKGLEEVRERGGSPVVVWDTGVSKVKSAGVSRLNLGLILLVT